MFLKCTISLAASSSYSPSSSLLLQNATLMCCRLGLIPKADTSLAVSASEKRPAASMFSLHGDYYMYFGSAV